MVGDAGQEAMVGLVADLVDAEPDQAVQAILLNVVCHDPLDDPPDRRPADSQQRLDLLLGHLLGQPRAEILEVARV